MLRSAAFQVPRPAREVGWRAVDFERAAVLDDELQRELPAGHRLKGRMAGAIAENPRNGKTLFAVTHLSMFGGGPSARLLYATVAMTAGVGTGPQRPRCSVYDCVDEWLTDELGDAGVGVAV